MTRTEKAPSLNQFLTLPELIQNYLIHIQKVFSEESWFNKETENKTLATMKHFFEEEKNPFSRSCLKGHFTGSCLLANPKTGKFVLTHHRKLGLWLQLGGHCDGDENIASVAHKEAEEESGLKNLNFSPETIIEGNPLPIDFDIHVVPKSKKDPKHLHLDVRFLIETKEIGLKISDESLDLKWFSSEEAEKVTDEANLIKLIRKYEHLNKQFKKNNPRKESLARSEVLSPLFRKEGYIQQDP